MLNGVVFALARQVVVSRNGLFTLTLDIRDQTYSIWYTKRFRFPRIYERKMDKLSSDFKWGILLKGAV